MRSCQLLAAPGTPGPSQSRSSGRLSDHFRPSSPACGWNGPQLCASTNCLVCVLPIYFALCSCVRGQHCGMRELRHCNQSVYQAHSLASFFFFESSRGAPLPIALPLHLAIFSQILPLPATMFHCLLGDCLVCYNKSQKVLVDTRSGSREGERGRGWQQRYRAAGSSKETVVGDECKRRSSWHGGTVHSRLHWPPSSI